MNRRRLVATAALSLGAAVALAGRDASAFDTGHHFDLTETVLRERDSGETPIKVVQVANWLTDYYASTPTSRDSIKIELAKLHFDNLYGTQDVARYWGWLMANARQAARDAAEADDPVALLMVEGLTLHAVQDFYAHSNWVEIHRTEPGAPYRRDTWLADGAPAEADVVTGSYPPFPSPPPAGHPEHGGYDFGLNKDSHVRPMWGEAYVFAYCATHEVVDALERWAEEVRPGFAASARDYRADAAFERKLDLAVESARKISMWVRGRGAEGHWKGGESGSASYLSGSALEWTLTPGSDLVHRIKERRIHERLTAGLYTADAPAPLPAVEAFADRRTIVIVGTTYVAEMRGGGLRIDRMRKADLYAVTSVGTQRYVDRVLRRKKRYSNPWMTIHVAAERETEIPVRMEVWDEDESLGRTDDACDVNPAAGRRDVAFRVRAADGMLQGDVLGRYDGPERPFEIGGADPDGALVLMRAFVRTRPLAGR